MSPRLSTSVLTGSERHEAKEIGAHRYVGCKQYRSRRDGLFAIIDTAVEAMSAAKFLNPYDGRVIGGFATAFVQEDIGALNWLKAKKYKALESSERRAKLLTYIGIYVAEDYLRSRRDRIPAEPRIALPGRMKGKIGAIFNKFRADSAELLSPDDQDDTTGAPPDDMVDLAGARVSFNQRERTDQLADLAIQLITEQLGTYESVVSETDEREIPKDVERRALAQAAFMLLRADDLEEIAADTGGEDDEALDPADFPNKAALAHALGVRYRDEVDQVAQIVLAKEEGNPEHGLIARLLPLKHVPDIPVVREAFEELQGHYIEVRTAVFFVFGAVREIGSILRISGRIRSFTVNPAEAGGATTMNPRKHDEAVTITLRRGQRWAEVDTRRATDAFVIRSVLRRTGEITPAAEPRSPAPLQREPFSRWDSRTIWMLDFMRQDLQADDLRLDNTLLATFRTPADPTGQTRRRRPRVDSVQLRGTQLHRHRDACLRIVEGSHLRDVEIRVRHGRSDDITAALVRFRLQWENDHLAVMTGIARGQKEPDPHFHRTIVRLVRHAAERELPEADLSFILHNIERIARTTEPNDGTAEFFTQAPAG